MNEEFYYIVSQICKEDPRYHVDSYEFVMEALSFAQKKFKRDKHVNGYEFLEGIKGLLMKKFGPMTIPVLDYWGVKKTEDFGNIVFNLEEYKIIARDKQEQYETFKDGYDFQEVFDKGYRKELAKRLKTMRY
ncbi:MAG: Minf_1886 family protein [Candidatus Omnitrophota bacterium]